MKTDALGDLTTKIKTWDPRRSPDLEFDYIDLGAVDNETKKIRNPVFMKGSDAPSRARQIVSSGDVIVSTVRPNLNAVAVIPESLDGATVSTGFAVLRPSRELDGRYLFHWVRSPRFISSMASKATGASYPAVSDRSVRESVIPHPPLEEQWRIAGILDQADAIRACRRQVLGHLDELADSVFLEMFGDPVNNPRGLPMHRLGDEATSLQYGPRFYNEAYSNEGIRIVRITDLNRGGRLNFGAMPKMAVTDDQQRKFGLSPGDIVFARTGATVGKLAIIRESDPPCIAGAYFIRIRLSDLVLPYYVAAVLRSRGVQSIIWTKSQQSAQQNFSGPGLRSLPLPVPPLEMQREFADRVERVNAQQAVVRRALDADNELFASLQSRAFRGEL